MNQFYHIKLNLKRRQNAPLYAHLNSDNISFLFYVLIAFDLINSLTKSDKMSSTARVDL